MAYNQLDIHHRAFKAYKKELKRGENDNKLRKAIHCAPLSTEQLSSVRFKCEIKTDWIEYVEANLGYVENAILENRQFILQQGETMLIEKAKRVSKASVEHLAQHSELITHVPEPDEELIPDKIYVVENDSNFAVYENRFLYMLLLTLSDFVDLRYAKIVDMWNKIHSELNIKKNISLGKRKMEFSLFFKEDSRDNPDTLYDGEAVACIERIRNIQRNVAGLLQTPLMKEVSHAPLIKLPITRTNVLKMDTNFKMAVELFDYINSYGHDGYTVQEIKEDIDHFSENMADDFAELISTSSYLCYRYGAKFNSIMEQRFDAENTHMREEEDKRLRQLLHTMREKLNQGKISDKEYLLALEKRNLSLENDREKINEIENENSEYRQKLIFLNESKDSLVKSNEQLEEEIRTQKAITREQAAIHQSEMKKQKRLYEEEIAELRTKYEEICELQLTTMAQLRGIRYQQGLMTPDDDYSSKELLLQLEKERAAFDKMFASQWKKAKKTIRKRAFRSSSTDQADSKTENTD